MGSLDWNLAFKQAAWVAGPSIFRPVEGGCGLKVPPGGDCPAWDVFVHRSAAECRLPGLHRFREVVSGVRAGQAGLSAPA